MNQNSELQYSDEQFREFIEDAVVRDGKKLDPRFYAISGSHLYGFSDESSDIDVRGFHTTPADRYAYLDDPINEVTANMDGVTDGLEHMSDVDLCSRELKRFAELLYKANYNIIESVLHGRVLMNGVPLEIEALRSLIRDRLPMNVPHSYLGMAKSNYHNHLDESKEGFSPTPKHFLYVYRGLLGAKFTIETGEVEPNIAVLAKEVPDGDPDLVRSLIDWKMNAQGEYIEGDLRERALDEIAHLFNTTDFPDSPDKSGYKSDLDDWMRKVRL